MKAVVVFTLDKDGTVIKGLPFEFQQPEDFSGGITDAIKAFRSDHPDFSLFDLTMRIEKENI